MELQTGRRRYESRRSFIHVLPSIFTGAKTGIVNPDQKVLIGSKPELKFIMSRNTATGCRVC